MKVISGFLKGRKIEGFDILGTRPTMDRVKESLFASIQNQIKDSICLDLFAGSGALGIEAISCGAKYCYFVDKNKKAINTINKNIDHFNIRLYSSVIHSTYQKVLKTIDRKFDIIFIDPPYATDYIEDAIFLIEKNDLLNSNGLLVCESDNLDKVIYSNTFSSVKEKKYGDKWIVILQKVV